MALFTITNLILLCCFTFAVGFGLLVTALERRGLKSFDIWMGLVFEIVMIEILLIFNFVQALPSNYKYMLSIIGGLIVSFLVSTLFFPQLARKWVARLFRSPGTKLYVALVLLLLFVWVPLLGTPVGALILTFQELPTTYRTILGDGVALVFGILSLLGASKAPAERRRRLLFLSVIMLKRRERAIASLVPLMRVNGYRLLSRSVSLMNKKRKQRKKKKHVTVGESYPVIRAVTHIRLLEVNPGKLAALDALAPVYLALCQQYVTLFCTQELPNKLRDPLYPTPLSERGPRVAIMQAAGIAHSWRSNRTAAYQQYQDDLKQYQHKQADGIRTTQAQAPWWREMRKLNSSVQLNRRDGVWWLTLSYDEEQTMHTPPDAPVVGIDVGIANFVTTSTGKHYGAFDLDLRARHKRDRAKRRRKAKLRACLKKKGAKSLPSTSSRTGQRLIRHVKQEINHAVNQCFTDPEHEGVQFAYEQLSVASMRFKAKAQNA